MGRVAGTTAVAGVTHYYVSTPQWSCRVDVCDGTILPTTARYLRHAAGFQWHMWRTNLERRYRSSLRIVELTTT